MSSYVTKKTPGNTEWFVRDRFGMFLHFGLYSMAGRHEWIKTRESMTDEQYDRYFRHFDPDMLDMKQWARWAKRAGMKYAILTTKHHEGFCLFDSAYTDYKSTNTPCGRDLVREYVDAFRAEGLKIGLYYSLIDWHHPQYTIDQTCPQRKDPNAPLYNETRDMSVYRTYMHNQVRELMTNYGRIDILWFDYSFPNGNPKFPNLPGKGKEDWGSEAMIDMVRQLQPGIIINNRANLEQDLFTPEQFQAGQWPRHKETGEFVVWEACQTFSGSWGYHRDEQTWKSPRMLIEMLIKTVALGGNLLMNVGPCARGYFDSRACEALEAYEAWMGCNSRSIYDCTMAEPEFSAPQGTLLTQSTDGKRLYIHLLSYPFKSISMTGIADKIDYAQFLHDGSEVVYKIGVAGYLHSDGLDLPEDTVYFTLPAVHPNTTVPVIELFLK